MVTNIRVGIGYDVHRLVEGRPLYLGGVRIDSELGLEGYSDADALLHAVMDALLGAAGLGDIGHYFPPGDERFLNASSLQLLTDVRSILTTMGWQVINVDSTIVAEQPKIAPYIDKMKGAIGKTLHVETAAVGIKATTNERMGFIGRSEGIAAIAVALIGRQGETLDETV